jgi:hypothetical protein
MEKSPTAYTAGPWHIDRQSPYSEICIKPYPGKIVCDIDGTDEESEANARLISAAPEMLDACYFAIGFVESWEKENGPTEFVHRALEIAIAKAEGRNAPHSSE